LNQHVYADRNPSLSRETTLCTPLKVDDTLCAHVANVVIIHRNLQRWIHMQNEITEVLL